jgi:hypothetical protein
VLPLSSLISSKPYNFSCFYVCNTIYNSEAVRVLLGDPLENLLKRLSGMRG